MARPACWTSSARPTSRPGGRRHHAAHRRLPGRGQRPEDHLPRHARPRGLHGHARPRRPGHGHRHPRRRGGRRRHAPDHRGNQPRQGCRRADHRRHQQDRPRRRRPGPRHAAAGRARRPGRRQYGGDIAAVQVSARTKEGIPELLETIVLVAEVLDLKANPDRPATAPLSRPS